MSFLCEDVIVMAPGKALQLDCETWCGLIGLGLGSSDSDEYGRVLPAESWKEEFAHDSLNTDKMPVHLSAEQAGILAGQLRRFSRHIPEREETGEVLDVADRCIDRVWRKYAVTTHKGWVETDDVEIVFLEEGKEIIRGVIELFERGPVKIDLAEKVEPGPRLRCVE